MDAGNGIDTSALARVTNTEIKGNRETVERSKKGLNLLQSELKELGKIQNLTPTDTRPLAPSEVPPFNVVWDDLSLGLDKTNEWKAHHSAGASGFNGLWSIQTDENGVSTVCMVEVAMNNDKEVDNVYINKTVGKLIPLSVIGQSVVAHDEAIPPSDVLPMDPSLDSYRLPRLDTKVEGGYQIGLRYDGHSKTKNIRLDLGAARGRFGLPTEPNRQISSLSYKL